MEEMRLMFFELDTRYCGFHVFGETCTIFYESVLLKFSNCCDIAFISVKLHNRDCIYISVLRHEVAYFDCSAEALSLCLNPASRRCDPMEACAHGASMMGMKPS